MSRNTAILARQVSKKYVIGLGAERHDTIRDQVVSTLTGLTRRRNRDMTASTIWAVSDVSFSLDRGEVIGLIGRNGAGKSTLLKILSRVTHPSRGRIELYGRVGSLLEVGTGFHPELSGRENVYLNGAMLGMKKAEIDRKFSEIVAFSGVEKFIDTPVKRYSSGMYVRLAFAVAAHLESEILLVDEVLAVGDAQFQRKCLGKMGDIASTGRSVVLVSHNMASIEALCQRGLVIDNGMLTYDGDVRSAVSVYLERNLDLTTGGVDLRSHENRSQDVGSGVFQTIRLLNTAREEVGAFNIGEPILIELTLDAGTMLLDSPIIALAVEKRGIPICVLSTHYMTKDPFAISGRMVLHCLWHPGWLAPGVYNISRLGIKLGTSAQRLDHIDDVLSFEITSRDIHGTGRVAAPGAILAPNGGWTFTTLPDSPDLPDSQLRMSPPST